jgi:hypothetical protein
MLKSLQPFYQDVFTDLFTSPELLFRSPLKLVLGMLKNLSTLPGKPLCLVPGDERRGDEELHPEMMLQSSGWSG